MPGQPDHIGRYRIDRVLGRGAMGIIYKAHDPEIDRDVALKLIRADLLDGGERADYLARFRREARAAGRCVHPNIVSLFDYALHEGNPFLVMEYVRGASLAQVLDRQTRFRPADAVRVMLQVLEALAYAHGLGVIHRDIKPANVLLLEGARVKVTDFGISRLGASTLTQGGEVIGTPSYMSPEQCRGDDVDARSDVFSAGVVLFELLTGERPWSGRTFTAVVDQVLHAEAADLRERVPERLAEVVARAMQKRPADRFGSAAAMAEALRGALHGTPQAEATVVASPGSPQRVPPPPSRAMPDDINDEVLSTLQRRLAEHVGPIAKVLVGSAVRKAANFDSLCELLAQNINSQEERQRFLRSVRQEFSGARTLTPAALTRAGSVRRGADQEAESSQPGIPMIPSSIAAQAEAELLRLIGPLAPMLVKRAAKSARSASEFWDALAQHIDRPADRAAFLRLKPSDLPGPS